jgi:hypothetical protein
MMNIDLNDFIVGYNYRYENFTLVHMLCGQEWEISERMGPAPMLSLLADAAHAHVCFFGSMNLDTTP